MQNSIFQNKAISMSLDDYIAEKLPLPVVIHSKTEASSSCVDLTLDDYIAQKRSVKSELQMDTLKNAQQLTIQSKRSRKRGHKKKQQIRTNSSISFGLYTKSALYRQQTTLCYKDPIENVQRTSSANDLSIEFENSNLSDDSQPSFPTSSNLVGRINNSTAGNGTNSHPAGIRNRLNFNHAKANGNHSPLPIMPANGVVKVQTSPEKNNSDSFIKMCQDMLPTLASKLFADHPVEDSPPIKYDLELQQQICEIQGKPLMYKCAGTEVLTFDGPGINVDVKPHQTERTLNQRFA